jgi:hypothetical protein
MELEPEPELAAPESRLSAWCVAFGVHHQQPPPQPRQQPQPLTSRSVDEVLAKIERDIPRTLPDHPLFADANGAGIAALRRLLHGLYTQHGAYCQVATGRRAILHCHLLHYSLARDSHSDLAVIAVVYCQNDSTDHDYCQGQNFVAAFVLLQASHGP